MRHLLPRHRSALVVMAASVLGLSAPYAAPPAHDTTHAHEVHGDSAHVDSLRARDLIQPDELGRLLAGPSARRPALLHVGFKVLYRSGHITGSKYVGPASKPEGLAALEKVLRPMPRQALLVLYCGCCPWKDCPNALPAARMAHAMGFKDVKVLYVAKNMQTDWIDKGLPTSEGEP